MIDFGFDVKPLKKRTVCDYCGNPLGLRRYIDNEFNKVYCSNEHHSEGQSQCIQRNQKSFFDIWRNAP